jgi:hypothetical protein
MLRAQNNAVNWHGQVAPGAPSGVGYAAADGSASGISQASNKQDSVSDSSFALATGVSACACTSRLRTKGI